MHSKRAILRRKIRSNRKRSQFNRIHLINLVQAGKHECCLNDYRCSRVISDTNEIITSILLHILMVMICVSPVILDH